MPAGMNGSELARHASRLRPGIKVLLSSGFTREENRYRLARAEYPFISKPYRPAILAKKLRDVLSEGVAGRTDRARAD